MYRPGRPKSCKYDTYRTRARGSIVDETLFGDPLSVRLMSRSKSMETISREGRLNPELEEQKGFDPLGSRPRGHFTPGKQRPKTALATMRVPRDLEFSPRDESRSNQDMVGSLVISSFEFRKIREASKEMTKEERELLLGGERSMSSPWAVRRAVQLPEPVYSPPALRTPSPRDGATLERANRLREENLEEVRRLNELILAAKCNAVLDKQVAEKERRLAEMAESDRHREEEIEEERKKGESMTNLRDKSINKFYSDYKLQLQDQLKEAEEERYRQLQIKEYESELRRKEEEAAREEDRITREKQYAKKLAIQDQFKQEQQELNRRQRLEQEKERIHQEQIHELETRRREAEEERERAEREVKFKREREIMRMSQTQEKEKSLLSRAEEVRLARQREEKERVWRENQINAERTRRERINQIEETRREQLEIRRRKEMEAQDQEKSYWTQNHARWKSEVEQERRREEEKYTARKLYQTSLKHQMEMREMEGMREKEEERRRLDEEERRRKEEKEIVDRVKERKFQELQDLDIPEKYRKEIQRQCTVRDKTKFTKSYHMRR
ncbi:trichohyalin isoform X2 [Eurytemora carolleeae]|uniref:trichohyalin isoform X2 n=1 Tax=Eurytemora carolleeae TaxID=1294199 RepID=UPI000C78E1B2|nr:trichohyalin isoform X2 [Eurytemora carolleeae]|eukprot:XP_023320416.1 trichohyalin-like isoform X2 [Eurytemora affinis]